jgi:hypothetical protein
MNPSAWNIDGDSMSLLLKGLIYNFHNFGNAKDRTQRHFFNKIKRHANLLLSRYIIGTDYQQRYSFEVYAYLLMSNDVHRQ